MISKRKNGTELHELHHRVVKADQSIKYKEYFTYFNSEAEEATINREANQRTLNNQIFALVPDDLKSKNSKTSFVKNTALVRYNDIPDDLEVYTIDENSARPKSANIINLSYNGSVRRYPINVLNNDIDKGTKASVSLKNTEASLVLDVTLKSNIIIIGDLSCNTLTINSHNYKFVQDTDTGNCTISYPSDNSVISYTITYEDNSNNITITSVKISPQNLIKALNPDNNASDLLTITKSFKSTINAESVYTNDNYSTLGSISNDKVAPIQSTTDIISLVAKSDADYSEFISDSTTSDDSKPVINISNDSDLFNITSSSVASTDEKLFNQRYFARHLKRILSSEPITSDISDVNYFEQISDTLTPNNPIRQNIGVDLVYTQYSNSVSSTDDIINLANNATDVDIIVTPKNAPDTTGADEEDIYTFEVDANAKFEFNFSIPTSFTPPSPKEYDTNINNSLVEIVNVMAPLTIMPTGEIYLDLGNVYFPNNEANRALRKVLIPCFNLQFINNTPKISADDKNYYETYDRHQINENDPRLDEEVDYISELPPVVSDFDKYNIGTVVNGVRVISEKELAEYYNSLFIKQALENQ